MLGANSRPLPDFLIIGAQKGGTTSLYAYLCEHPQILRASTKEIHYFSTNYRKGLRWYRSHFQRKTSNISITGEATPYYLFNPVCPARIKESLPDIKLIVMLRDPVSRAWSQYNHNLKKKLEQLDFKAALKREEMHLVNETKRLISEKNYLSSIHATSSYLARGIYADQLEAYWNYFHKDQILIIRSEDFFDDPQSVYSDALRFLGLSPKEIAFPSARNVGVYKDRVIPQEEHLRAYFAPHNRRLYELIDRDMNW